MKEFYSFPSNQHKTIAQFIENLERGSDLLYTINDRRWLNFAKVLEMDGEKLKLKYKPEEMIFRN